MVLFHPTKEFGLIILYFNISVFGLEISPFLQWRIILYKLNVRFFIYVYKVWTRNLDIRELDIICILPKHIILKKILLNI